MGRKYYAVANGRNNGVYDSWDDCRSQVSGYSNAKFKSFSTKAEANQFAAQGTYRSSSSRSSNYNGGGWSDSTQYSSSYNTPDYGYGSSRSYSRSSRSSGTASATRDTDVVYTDGSALGNGKSGARAGWGVYWSPNDSRNKSGKVSHGEQTNNRGELQAVKEAVGTIANETRGSNYSQNRRYEIRADSQYARDALTKWGNNWERYGWKTSTGGEVKNQDLIQSTRSQVRQLREQGVDVDITYIPGHAGHKGNEAADRLARSAANRP